MSFASLLNDTCTIYKRVKNVDEETEQLSYELTPIYSNVKCALQHGGGTFDRTGRLARENNTDRLYLFPITGISKMETVVEVRGNKYRVREIVDMGGREMYLRLDLERYSVNG